LVNSIPSSKAPSQFGFSFPDPVTAEERKAAPGCEAEAFSGAMPEAVSQPGPVPGASARRIWTVGELVASVRDRVERQYGDCWVEGEISNLRAAPSGHIYFTLKDGDAQLLAVLFRRQASLLRFRPENGLAVLARGKVSVFEQRGQLQLVAEALEPVGAGSLQIAFEQLKARLAAEGLFAAERKRVLPAFPRAVGIVTSPSGAVIRDFLQVARRRYQRICVLLYPATVQGDGAAAEVCAGIRHFNQARCVDLIVIARGGGSLEDLAPFNTELLARAIAESALPVVSAVGHETDFTIADFVADLRAPTPSAAAEMVTAALHTVERRVEELREKLDRGARHSVIAARERYSRLSPEAAFARLQNGLGRRQQRVDDLRFQMERAWGRRHAERGAALERVHARLLRQDLSKRLRAHCDRAQKLEGRMLRSCEAGLRRRQAHWAAVNGRLESLSPLAVLRRGYALVYREDGGLLREASTARIDETITTRLANGSVTSRITGKNA
jgi:exodeoxyribonuclease VII large subunit